MALQPGGAGEALGAALGCGAHSRAGGSGALPSQALPRRGDDAPLPRRREAGGDGCRCTGSELRPGRHSAPAAFLSSPSFSLPPPSTPHLFWPFQPFPLLRREDRAAGSSGLRAGPCGGIAAAGPRIPSRPSRGLKPEASPLFPAP